MGRAAVVARLGVIAATALLAVACAISPVTTGPTPPDSPGAPSARGSTPAAMLNPSPTSQVLGERATPTAIAAFGTPVPASHQSLMADMQQFGEQLQRWAAGAPAPNDLLDMVDRANTLMADMQQVMPQMSSQDREQALAKMSALMGQMIQVMDAHARQTGMPNRPGGMMGPSGTPATGGMMVAPTPAVGGPMTTRQMMFQMDQMRDQMMRMWAGQPADTDIISMMSQMQGLLLVMSRQASSLTSQDLQVLTADMAQAMDNLVRVMETYVQQEMVAAP